MDPPAHIFESRTTLDQFLPEQFIGKALVIDCRDLKEGQPITIDKIDMVQATSADFLLFNLGWDKRWKDVSYFNDSPCIDDENLTLHKAIFKNKDIVNIENLKNLDQCGNDLFWFSCFPLKIENCDGSPNRAIAWYD